MRVGLEELVELFGAGEAEVPEAVVVGLPEFADAVETADVQGMRSLVAVGGDLPLGQLHVVDLAERGVAHDVRKADERDDLQGRDQDADGVDDGGAVERAGDGGDGLQPVAFAACKQRGQIVRVGDRALFFRAVSHQVGQHTDRGAAEGMAEEVDALDLAVIRDLAPVRERGLFIGLAVTGMAVFLRMGNAVVDTRAGQGRVNFTGAVPGAADAAETRGNGLVALFSQPFRDAAGKAAPVRHKLVDEFILTEAEHAVAEHECFAADLILFLGHSLFSLSFFFVTC